MSFKNLIEGITDEQSADAAKKELEYLFLTTDMSVKEYLEYDRKIFEKRKKL